VIEFRNPSSVSAYIEARPELVVMVEEHRLDDVLFNLEKANEPVLRGLARIGLDDVMTRRRHAIRKAVKAGRPVKTAFAGIVKQEEAWADTCVAIDRRHSAELSAAIGGLIDDYNDSVLAKWRLDNGQELGNATVGYVRGLAHHETKLAEGHAKNAAFYGAIAGDHDDSATVRDVVTVGEAEAARLEIFG
jgi:hypothetical protein